MRSASTHNEDLNGSGAPYSRGLMAAALSRNDARRVRADLSDQLAARPPPITLLPGRIDETPETAARPHPGHRRHAEDTKSGHLAVSRGHFRTSQKAALTDLQEHLEAASGIEPLYSVLQKSDSEDEDPS